MSESKREVEWKGDVDDKLLDALIAFVPTRHPWPMTKKIATELKEALQRISFLEAELQTVLDRAERYMDLCGEKDKEIERLKVLLVEARGFVSMKRFPNLYARISSALPGEGGR